LKGYSDAQLIQEYTASLAICDILLSNEINGRVTISDMPLHEK